MTTKRKKSLSTFRVLIDILRTEVDEAIFLHAAYILTLVADNPDVPMSELARLSGLSQASVSRNVAQLGSWNRHRESGYGLVESFEDPMERRRKLVRLTPRGEKVIAKMREAMV